ncbi:MAG: hypothetical protein AAB739_01970 [Patescibacteria group bacterium]
MVATLGQMSEMERSAQKPDVASVNLKPVAETLLKILGGVAIAVKIALGLVFHLGTGGIFLGDSSREVDGERNEITVASVGIEYPGHINPTDDNDDRIDGYYPRGV